MTHKTVGSWEWGHGSDPVDQDIPDWVISAILVTIGLSCHCGCVLFAYQSTKDTNTKRRTTKNRNCYTKA